LFDAAQWKIVGNIFTQYFKVEKISKNRLDLIPSPSLSVKIQAKHCFGFQKFVDNAPPAMFCLYTSSKLSR